MIFKMRFLMWTAFVLGFAGATSSVYAQEADAHPFDWNQVPKSWNCKRTYTGLEGAEAESQADIADFLASEKATALPLTVGERSSDGTYPLTLPAKFVLPESEELDPAIKPWRKNRVTGRYFIAEQEQEIMDKLRLTKFAFHLEEAPTPSYSGDGHYGIYFVLKVEMGKLQIRQTRGMRMMRLWECTVATN